MNIQDVRDKLETEQAWDELLDIVREGFNTYKPEESNHFELARMKGEIIAQQPIRYDGGELYTVFTLDGVMFQTFGSYSSWSDSDWDDIRNMTNVKPVEVTIVEYEEITS